MFNNESLTGNITKDDNNQTNDNEDGSTSRESDQESSTDEEGEVEVTHIEPTESLAITRSRRSNAGARMSRLLDAEEAVDDFYKTTYGGFDDAEDDEEFAANENEAEDLVDSDFDIDETIDVGQDAASAEAEAAAEEKRKRSKKAASYRDPKARKVKTEEAPKSSLAVALEAASNLNEISVASTSTIATKKTPSAPPKPKPMASAKHFIPIAKNLRDSTKRHSKEVKDMLVKRNRQQSRQKAKMRRRKALQADEHVPKTHEEMLEEAKLTEIINTRSLKEYRNAEVEKVKRSKVTTRNLTNVPMIKHRAWIEEIDEPDQNKKRKVVRSCVVFPDESHMNKYFPSNETVEAKNKALEKAQTASGKMCIVRSCVAKYLDPLTGLPYSDEAAFKYIRTQYVKYLTDLPQLKDHPIVQAFLAQSNEKHSQILLNKNGRIHSVKKTIAVLGSAADIKHAVIVARTSSNKVINNNGDNQETINAKVCDANAGAGTHKSIMTVTINNNSLLRKAGEESVVEMKTDNDRATSNTSLVPAQTITLSSVGATVSTIATTLPSGQLMMYSNGQKTTHLVHNNLQYQIIQPQQSLQPIKQPQFLTSASFSRNRASAPTSLAQQQQQQQQQQQSIGTVLPLMSIAMSSTSSAVSSSTALTFASPSLSSGGNLPKTVVINNPIQLIPSSMLNANASNLVTTSTTAAGARVATSVKTMLKPTGASNHVQQQAFHFQTGPQSSSPNTTNLLALNALPRTSGSSYRRIVLRNQGSTSLKTYLPLPVMAPSSTGETTLVSNTVTSGGSGPQTILFQQTPNGPTMQLTNATALARQTTRVLTIPQQQTRTLVNVNLSTSTTPSSSSASSPAVSSNNTPTTSTPNGPKTA